MANHCEPGYLSVVRLVRDFTNTGTECYFQVLGEHHGHGSGAALHIEHNLTPLEVSQPRLQILSLGRSSTFSLSLSLFLVRK